MGQFTLVFTCFYTACPRIHPAQFPLNHRWFWVGTQQIMKLDSMNWIFFYPPKQDQRRLKTYNSIIFHRNSIWTRRSVSTCFHTFQGHPRPSQNTPGPSGLEVSLPPVVFGCSPHPALAWRPTSSSARDFSRERWMASRWFLMIFDVYLFFLVGWLWVLSARTKVEWNLERFFPPGTRYHQDPSSTASLQP